MNVTDSESVEQLIGELTRETPVRFPTGQVTAVAGDGTVTVNIGGNDRVCRRLLSTPVDVGDNVLVLRDAHTITVLGPIATTQLPITGTVASAPSNSFSIVVTTSLGEISAWFPDSYTPTVGDQVILIWLGTQPLALGRGRTGTPPPPAPKPRPPTPRPPAPKPNTGTRVFTAVSSDTRRGGVWRNDDDGNVVAGTAPGYPGVNTGAWFTGNRPKATLHGATVENAWIWLGRTDGGNFGPQTVHLYRVNDPRRAGDIDFTSDTHDVALDVGQRGWFDLPNDLAQALIDSGGSVGVKAPAGPYVRLWGLAQSGMAGAIKIAWRRD